MKNKMRFNQILRNIKSIKIQGASNIAKAGFRAYQLFPTSSAKKKLIAVRPTEPMLEKVLNLSEKQSEKEILKHFREAQEKINRQVLTIIKNNDIIFTHCHSTNVVNSLIYAKKKGKNFQVYNTETRPLFQGRKTAKELSRAKIKVTHFTDNAIAEALNSVDKVFLGADALTEKGIINKIGSELIARIAKENKIPVYIIADSWKFTKKPVPIEQRSLNEVWNIASKNIKIRNPAFEFVPKKYLTKIISELGILSYDRFLRIVNKQNIF